MENDRQAILNAITFYGGIAASIHPNFDYPDAKERRFVAGDVYIDKYNGTMFLRCPDGFRIHKSRGTSTVVFPDSLFKSNRTYYRGNLLLTDGAIKSWTGQQ